MTREQYRAARRRIVRDVIREEAQRHWWIFVVLAFELGLLLGISL